MPNGDKKTQRKRRKVARKTAKQGGLGASTHQTGYSTPNEMRLQQQALEGRVDISSQKKYEAEKKRLDAVTGTPASSHKQRIGGDVKTYKNATTTTKRNKLVKPSKPKKR